MSGTAQAPTASRGDRRYDFSADIGYQRWPELPLPLETWTNLAAQAPFEIPPLDLSRRWIHTPDPFPPVDIAVGFTDCHFELKVGLWDLLTLRDTYSRPPRRTWQSICGAPGSRWLTEAGHNAVYGGGLGWCEAAAIINHSRVVLADCSALHVLAVAMGKPVLVMEPMKARWNPIFYPLGMDGPQVTMVKGLDGKPTFDARHTRDALEALLG
jgi:hypothetical protein